MTVKESKALIQKNKTKLLDAITDLCREVARVETIKVMDEWCEALEVRS